MLIFKNKLFVFFDKRSGSVFLGIRVLLALFYLAVIEQIIEEPSSQSILFDSEEKEFRFQFSLTPKGKKLFQGKVTKKKDTLTAEYKTDEYALNHITRKELIEKFST